MKKLLTLFLFCFITFLATAQEKVSSITKTIQLQSETISKLKISDRKRIQLVDSEGSYTGEYMILRYTDEVVNEYDLFDANGSIDGKIKHYSNGEILIINNLGKVIRKERIAKDVKKD